MAIDNWNASFQAWQRARDVVGGGVASGARLTSKPHPIFMKGGSGSRLVDIEDNSYIDYVLGWGPVIAGHAHPHIVEAVQRQVGLGATYGSGHAYEYLAAEKLLALIPGTEKLLWTNTGSEATQIALRLARAATGRHKVIKFVGNYHGWSDQFLVGYRPDAEGRLDGLGTPGQTPSVLDDVVLVPWGDLDALEQALGGAGSDIAAVFMDAVMSNSGVFTPPHGYFDGVRRLCDGAGAVFVLDEVLTGFRVALGGAAVRFSVDADLIVLAKAIGSGYPVAAVAGRAHLIDQVTRGVMHAGTYNGNPLVLAAVDATLDILAKPGVYERMDRLSAKLAAGVRDAFGAVDIPVTVNQVGALMHCLPGVSGGSRFPDYLASDYGIYDGVAVELLRRGIFVPVGGRLYLSTEHSEADIDETVAAYREALQVVASARA
ncbi:aspartate aminotransferase family protein [Microtetraspora glauca]|uniref:Aspartate aminotransferase family protein n=1 Tax=Microtetraspora glauca TaxID=1996 RepID=A0ABV3GI42_MICGL